MKSTIRVVALLGVLCAPATSFAGAYADAEAAFSRGQYDRAMQLSQKAVDEAPDLAGPMYLLAMSASRARDYATAEKAFENLVARASLDSGLAAKVYANYARVLLDAQKFPEARALLDSGLSKIQPDAWMYNVSGRIYLQMGDSKKAAEHFQAATSLNQSAWIIFNNLGLAQMHNGELSDAERAFDSAIELNQFAAVLYNNRGSVREQQGDFDGAREDFESALRVQPNHPKATVSLQRIRSLLEKTGVGGPQD